MSEPRKNRLSIDGAQVKDDEHVASYKPIPETESEFRTSRSSLAKSKEKISADGAEEKLLQKEDEAKIITRVDMADAKYVVGDHRNGDAKIELDANKREFTGLTKEELMKYADDPLWVKIRWCLFVLFWAAWLAMLAGAIAIIVQAPKCARPEPKKWYQKGPLVDLGSASPAEVEMDLKLLQTYKIQGVFIEAPTYEVLEKADDVVKPFKSFFEKAKEFGVKVIVDLTPNFISKNHNWFKHSEDRIHPFTDYFLWSPAAKEHNATGHPQPVNNWRSNENTSAWTYSTKRGEFYLHQYGEDQPDLNFRNKDVQDHFDKVIHFWIQIGASGIRLVKARQLLVNSSWPEETPSPGSPGLSHDARAFWRRDHTHDQPGLAQLLRHFNAKVQSIAGPDPVFTLKEDSEESELFLLGHNVTLAPPVAAPLSVSGDMDKLKKKIEGRLPAWPALQLKDTGDDNELASFAMLLPAAPVLTLDQLHENNDTLPSESLNQLVSMRDDVTIEHGDYRLAAVPARNDTTSSLLVCDRWKPGHTGYLSIYNPRDEELRANLSVVESLPPTLTVHHVSHKVHLYTNFTTNHVLEVDDVLVPPKSTLVLSYVPKSTTEQ